jgi:DNA polymerase type B, organellar and viral
LKPNRGKYEFLDPIRGEARQRPFVVFDIESKKNDTQDGGFTRPFMCGFYDGKNFQAFFNEQTVKTLPWQRRAIAKGGCVDLTMRYLLGQRPDGRYDFAYKGCDVYAHNMGAFDGLFLPAWLEMNRNWVSYKIMPIQSRIQMIEVWRYTPSRPRRTEEERRKALRADRKLGVVRILDSFRVMPISLDKIIKMFNLRKDGEGKDKIDYNLPEWEIEKWTSYNRVDTEQLWHAIFQYQKLIVNEMGGEVGITAPATAMKLLRRKYIPDEIKIHRNVHFPDCDNERCESESKNGCAHDFFRVAYFGGRTEVYQLRGTGYYFDVNSSYPFSMKKMMPIGELTALGENEDFSHFTNGEYVGFVRCTIEIPENTYLPPIPKMHGGKLKFPVGTFSGTWDWCELECLRRVGGKIIHVEKSAWIKGKKFLGNFVDSLYALRNDRKNNPGKSETAKIMLNATFGKFGMEQDRLEMIILKPGDPDPDKSRYPGEARKNADKRIAQAITDGTLVTKAKKKGGNLSNQSGIHGRTRTLDLAAPSASYEHDSLIRVRDTHVDAPYIIPQIAAHITALSRVLLWSFAMDVLDKGNKIFYADTDSLLTDFNNLKDTNDLGGLKREFNGEKLTVISYGPKTYVLEKETPFENEHIKEESKEGKAGDKRCEEFCPGCKKDTPGEHEEKDNKRLCKEKCPGCSTHKVMMKGVPKDLRTRSTLERMSAGEEVSFQLHQKLGALAKGGFSNTPTMVNFKKSMKSKYDKRSIASDGNDTLPIVLIGPEHLSASFALTSKKQNYKTPSWLERVTSP